MSLGPLELEIRRVPGVLSCQFTPTDVLVLVEPSADAAAVSASVEGILAAAAESRRVAVIGGTAAAAAGSAGAFWWLRKHQVAVAGATVATFLAAAGAAAVTGTLTNDNHPHGPVAAPVTTTTTTLPPARQPGGTPPTTEVPNATTTTTTKPAARPIAAQILRVALPGPLPRFVETATTQATPSVTPPTTEPPVKTPPARVPDCDAADVVLSFRFVDNGQPLADLRRRVSAGDQVSAIFTLASGCATGSRLALVTHTMPDPVYVKAHARGQRIFDAAEATLNGGTHTLGPVRVPDCYFQIDFAVFGPGSNGSYLYSSATGGSVPCGRRNPSKQEWLAGNSATGPGPGAEPQAAYIDETRDSRSH